MVQLIIAEKPSVARDIARVVGARQRQAAVYQGEKAWVTWCIGHMVGLCEPGDYDPAWKAWSESTLPILPDVFSLRPLAARRKHWSQLKGLLRDASVTEVVNACDAGREGELIFRYVYELSGCRKPVQRLWLASLTDSAVRTALTRMRPGQEYDDLAHAARCRSEADWLVGLNATRALTLAARRGGAGRTLMSVGRVQTPTLAMLVNRERAIEAFVSEAFWKVFAQFQVEHGSYEGVYQGPSPTSVEGQGAQQSVVSAPDRGEAGVRLKTRKCAEDIVTCVRGGTGRVQTLVQKKRRERPPLLYDLTSLQREANKRFHLSAAATLSVAQELYERHKLITYPRVDSRYLTTDLAAGFPKILDGISVEPYRPFSRALLASGQLKVTGRVVDDSKVRDHHAIIPTGKIPDFRKLSANAGRIFDLIIRRFLGAFCSDAVFALTKVMTEVNDHIFVARGRIQLEAGWQAVDPPHSVRSDVLLPELAQGDAAVVAGVRVHEGKTEPPPRYSEGTILAAMERAGSDLEEEELRKAIKTSGLGTPATRANVIETLLTREYVRRQRKTLIPTADGVALIDAIQTPALKSPRLTADWESRLTAIAEGRHERVEFMQDVRAFTRNLVDVINAAKIVTGKVDSPAPTLGRCPICGASVRSSPRAYVCATGRDCSFVIFNRVAGRKISSGLAQVLLSGRRSQVLRGFRSKKGRPFRAALELDERGRVALCFDGAEGPRGSEGARGSEGHDRNACEVSCPVCREGMVIRGRRGWGCSRWRGGCSFVVSFEQYGTRLEEQQAHRLFRTGQTDVLDDLLTPEGVRSRGHLMLDLKSSSYVRLCRGQS